jgi:hypothetical protein
MRSPEVKKMAGQKPVAKFKAGQVSAALWENEIPPVQRVRQVSAPTPEKKNPASPRRFPVELSGLNEEVVFCESVNGKS